MKDLYVRLIAEYCRLAGLDQPARIVEGGPVQVGDVCFSLLYSEKINPEVLLIYCEYGVPAPGREADAFRFLLQRNLAGYDGKGGATYMVSPATGKILCAYRLPLDGTTAQVLSEVLSDMADQALHWRQDYRMGAADIEGRRQPSARRPARFSAADRER